MVEMEQATNRPQASAFEMELEGEGADALFVASRFRLGRKVTAASLAAKPLRTAIVEAALDDEAGGVAMGTSRVSHGLIITLLPPLATPKF